MTYSPDPLPLFQQPPPYQRHSDTSKAAAERIEPKAGSLRAKVLAYLRVEGPSTDKEIQAGLNMQGSTQRPRRIELVESGHVVDSGERRDRSTVWVAT